MITNYFDRFYQYAKDGDTEALDRLLKLTPSIDERKQGTINMTAAAQLVLDGYDEAAKLLTDRGANPLFIIGVLVDSNKQDIRPLLEKWLQHPRNLTMFEARQKAQSYTPEEMRHFLESISVEKNSQAALYIAKGAAWAGNEDLVNFLIKEQYVADKDFCNIIHYYVLNGHKDKAIRFVDTQKKNYSTLIIAAALTNDEQWMEELKLAGAEPLISGFNRPNANCSFDHLFNGLCSLGFAKGGYNEELLAALNQTHQHEKFLNPLVIYAAGGGHYELVNVLRQKCPGIRLDDLIKEAKNYGHINYSRHLQEEKAALQSTQSPATSMPVARVHQPRLNRLFGSPNTSLTTAASENQRLSLENQKLSLENQKLREENQQLITGRNQSTDPVSPSERRFGQTHGVGKRAGLQFLARLTDTQEPTTLNENSESTPRF